VDDGLNLNNMFITAVCRCVPPDNKPTSNEISTCLPYLHQEISMMGNLKVVVALGSIAHNYLLKIFSELSVSNVSVAFKHGQTTKIDALNIFFISSYHPSRQNTQTGRLTIEMFDRIWERTNLIISETIDYS
jgi:uracil-DNA glycosylase family 4